MDTSFAPLQPHSRVQWNELASEDQAPRRQRADFRPAVPHSIALSPTPSAWTISKGKRCLDFFVAALALIFCWPLLLLIAVLVRLDSYGPVIFRQQRMGRDGVLFTVFKFRTMEAVSREAQPSVTKRGDSRVTRIGRLLRKYKLDELPQLLNVLRGDMSLIGPRPKLPHHEVMEMPVRPGLTGAATLAFRCEEEMLESIPDHELEEFCARTITPLKARLDWDYMGQATLISDVALLYYTASACLFRHANSWAIDLSKIA